MNTFVEDMVAEAIRRQPWYQKNANTIVAGLTALSAILSFVATAGFGLPPLVAAGIPVAVNTIGVVATKLMPNGVQYSTAKKLSATQAASAPAVAAAGMSVIAAEIERVRGYVGQHRLGG